jgi:CDP-glucose 4,6-dehydratase
VAKRRRALENLVETVAKPRTMTQETAINSSSAITDTSMGSASTRDDFWRARPVFVTGATGFLGGVLVRRLLQLGADVTCLVRDFVPHCEYSREGLMAQTRVVRGDLCDGQTLQRALNENDITTVFHLAAQALVGAANRHPLSTFESNVRGTWQLLEACRSAKTVRHIAFASSDKAYGASDTLPYTEETPLCGRHPYDVSKSCADLIAQSYATTFGVPVCIARCGNLFGGGDLNWSRLIPGTMRSALHGEIPVIRSDGGFVRDYLHVEDAANSYLLLAQALEKNPRLAGEAFNFSLETPLSVLEVVQRTLRVLAVDVQPEVRNEASHEIREQYLSAAKARITLGWQPQMDFDAALKITAQWYRNYLNASQ